MCVEYHVVEAEIFRDVPVGGYFEVDCIYPSESPEVNRGPGGHDRVPVGLEVGEVDGYGS